MVFLLALSVRLIALYLQSLNAENLLPFADAANYFRRAWQLLSGKAFDQEFFFQPLGYTFFLTALFSIFGAQIKLVLLVQCLLGALTATLTCLVAGLIVGYPAGLAAGIIAAFYGPLIAYDLMLLSESLSIFLAMLALYLTLKPTDQKPYLRIFMVGLILGAVSLTRPNLSPPLFLAILWFIYSNRKKCKNTQLALTLGIFFVAVAIVLLPVTAVVYSHTGIFTFLPQGGGIDTFMGNHPDQSHWLGVRTYEYDRFHRIPASHGIFAPWQQSRFFYGQTFEIIAQNPGGAFLLLLKKCCQFFALIEIPNSESVYAFTSSNPLLRLLTCRFGFFAMPFGLVLPFFLIGYFACFRKIPVPLHALVVLYPLSIVAFHVCGRFRLPIVPVLVIIAVMGAGKISDWLKQMVWSPIIRSATAVVIVLILLSLWSISPRESINYLAEQDLLRGQWLYNRLKNNETIALSNYEPDMKTTESLLNQARAENSKLAAIYCALGLLYFDGLPDNELAIKNFDRAIAIDPGYYETYGSKGLFLLSKGQMQAAFNCFDKAIELHQGDARGYDGRGLARLEGQNDITGALQDFNQAIKVNPAFASAYNNRGQAKARQQKLQEAIEDFSRAIELSPRFQQAYNNRASAYFRAGKLDEALLDYKAALSIFPNYQNALYNRGVLYLQRNSTEAARADLQRYQSLGGELEPSLLQFINRQ